MIIMKSGRELSYMRDAGRIVAETHQELKKTVAPGISTQELDQVAEDYITQKGAVPAFKGYHGFPATICASINDEVVHGIPGLRALKTGDIISIDIGAVINGYYGDAAVTLPVGVISKGAAHLLEVTEKCLYKGIEQVKVDNRLTDISHAIQSYVEQNGYSVVRDFVGHGIGTKMHEEPQLPNFGMPGRGPRLKPGMCLAIEPMVNMGTYEVETLLDNWTVVTKDKQLSAHFEHSVAVTEKGPLILTEI
ncbi:MAG: methionine aminopeptidase [Clostridiaceae bacterium BRH_c20a]|nr:MAG: methionine aminopeptidase [Clostridiaceae bacterium BRH_c20a]